MEAGVEVEAGYQITSGLKISGAFRKSILTNLPIIIAVQTLFYRACIQIGPFMILQGRVATFMS